MTSKQYFKEWVLKGRLKQRQSLENIRAVCDALDKEGITLFGKVVADACKEEFGFPVYGSLRNNQVLMEYIKLRASEQRIVSANPKIMESALKTENRLLRMLVKQYVEVKDIW